MSYVYKEFFLPSTDGKNTLHAEMYLPEGEVRAVVQLAHGMIDYVSRYTALAEYLTSEGYALIGNDHLGHGKTAASAEDFGYFADNGGCELVVDDLYAVNGYIHGQFPGKPVVLMGHSMGSFMARLYAVKYPESITALIIHGTGGPNPLLLPGVLISKIIKAVRGPRHRSELINTLAFGSYNSRFPKEEGHNAWLTRDAAAVAGRDSDPYTSYKFTVSGYLDLFRALGDSNKASWFKSFPKDMPTLLISGDADPVCNYGKGIYTVYNKLICAGANNVTPKLYPGARHELFNETNRDEVFDFMGRWLGGVLN